jgi:SAM-dependent methyltransferase
MNPYDRVLYVNQPYARTHPTRMASLARLHGMNPPAIETARVLDIGASEGGNIIPMAMTLPNARFTGIDLAGVPVQRGNSVIQDLGLSNIQLQQMNLLDLDESFGEFDYIIAHGFYAWTPPAVRDKLLAVCNANLSPNGVAFISYNTQPAGHVRKLLREMMLFHIGDAADTDVRLRRAREMLRMLASRKAQVGGIIAGVAAMAEELLRMNDSALYHDSLAPIYEPVYLTEFVEHARKHGLDYVADADVLHVRRYNLEPALLEEIQRACKGDRVKHGQYLDMLRVRGFRQSLVCHQGIPIADEWEPERAVGMYISCRARETAEGKFEVAGAATISQAPGPVVELLRHLERIWPQGARIDSTTADLALNLVLGGIAEIRMDPGAAVQAGAKPVASPLARYQIRCGATFVSSLDHHSVAMEDESARHFLSLLDGSRDAEALAGAMGCSTAKVRERLQELSRHGLMLG